MGRPIGSVNKAKPFADALRMEISVATIPRHLRAIARKLIEMAEGGDLQAIKEVGDRLDGKCAQVVERGDAPVEALSDAELFAIIRGGSRETLDEPNLLQICGPIRKG
jgi:hypothetical protein